MAALVASADLWAVGFRLLDDPPSDELLRMGEATAALRFGGLMLAAVAVWALVLLARQACVRWFSGFLVAHAVVAAGAAVYQRWLLATFAVVLGLLVAGLVTVQPRRPDHRPRPGPAPA